MRSRPAEAMLFCPQCSGKVAQPTPSWTRAACTECTGEFYGWELNSSPSLSKRLISVLVVWALVPAILLTMGLLLPRRTGDSSDPHLGSILVSLAFHGGPAILYAWSALLLRRLRVGLWLLAAVPLTAAMVVLDFVLTAVVVSLLWQLMR
jgi:hypothetical protein